MHILAEFEHEWIETQGLIADARTLVEHARVETQCKAKAIGSGSEGADSSLQEQYNKDLTLSLVITKISKLVTTLNPLLDWSSQNSQIR
ncbi:hypothetical protein L195_g027657 [Trifolium pratense]|nr:hypothetical protein L195_g027657 [Trifolium pratense]